MAAILELNTDGAHGYNFVPRTTTARKLEIEDPGADAYIPTLTDSTVLTATGAEINRVADASSRVVTAAAATTALSITVTQHSDKIVVLNTNNATGMTVTFPVASGSGAHYTIVNNVVQTQGSITITCGTLDVLSGIIHAFDTTAVATDATVWVTSATSDKVVMNRTTTGGLGGDTVEVWDIAANVYLLQGHISCSGDKVTPLSAT